MTARASAVARTAPARAPRPRPELRPVERPTTEPRSRLQRLRRRLSPVTIAAGIVVASLLAVVAGNMVLASGQLRLEQVQQNVTALQSSEASSLEHVTSQVSPSSVALSAANEHLVPPSQVLPIPSVSLERRLPPPVFSSAPCCSLNARP